MSKTKQKYWLLGIFAILVFGILVLSLGIHQKTSPQPQLYIQYLFTAEGTYQNIEINQSKLVYTYFPEEVAKEKCKQWTRQVPCWAEEDLKTKEAILSKDEINDLIGLINETGFMNLEENYGGSGGYQRYYPYILIVKIGEREKKVVYQSFPNASPMPEAFKKVRDKLLELVNEKFK